MLIRAGARVDMKNENSETALHLAIDAGSEECVEALLDGKCILDHPNAAGAFEKVGCPLRLRQVQMRK